MFRNDRTREIAAYLLDHNTYTSGNDLTERFGISARTLRADMARLNRELVPYKASVKLKRGLGYRLLVAPEDVPALRRALDAACEPTLDTAEERIAHLLVRLLYTHERLTQDDLANEVYVSVNTMAGYLRSIRETLHRHNLALDTKTNLGYLVAGSELDRRACLADILSEHPSVRLPQAFDLEARERERLDALIGSFHAENNMQASDHALRNACERIVQAISRVRAGFLLEANTVSAQASQLIPYDGLVNGIEQACALHLPAPERNYIAFQLAARAGTTFDTPEQVAHARAIAQRIVESVRSSYRIDLTGDSALLASLSSHVQSILAAKRLGLSQDNPLLNTVRTRYILPWEMAQTAVEETFAYEACTLNEDEVGYIALHLGAALERRGAQEEGTPRARIAVLADNGQAEGQFVASLLQSQIGERGTIVAVRPVREAAALEAEHVDFAVATAPIAGDVPFPVVRASIPFDQAARDAIEAHLHACEQGDARRIERYFDEQLFCRIASESKDEVLARLCTMAEGTGICEDGFRESVLERERRIPTAMNDMMALPHPLAICCRESRVAVALLDNPVRWSPETEVSIVVMLALSDDQRDITTLYDTLAAAMNDRDLLVKLQQARTLEEFLLALEAGAACDAW